MEHTNINHTKKYVSAMEDKSNLSSEQPFTTGNAISPEP